MFLSDLSSSADFSIPLPNYSNWSRKIAQAGETGIGKVFLKNADRVTRISPTGVQSVKYGIANSGKTLRKTPFAIAGGLGLAYGGYRAKKTYDKYKPEIKMGRSLWNTYKDFKNTFTGD